MEKPKARKIKKRDEVHGEYEVEVSDGGGCDPEEAAGDAAGGEHHGAERRSDTADHDVDDRDKAEVVDADAEASCHRQQQRGDDGSLPLCAR